MTTDWFDQMLVKYPGVVVLAIDPGETTGICTFKGSELLDARQLATGLMPHAAVTVRDFIRFYSDQFPDLIVVIEDYRVYAWKTKDHAWESLHTSRLIGAVELICHDLGVLLVKQSAQIGKGFCTDDKLQAWGFWQKGERHARDAIRHACYYLLFRVAQLQNQNHQAQETKP